MSREAPSTAPRHLALVAGIGVFLACFLLWPLWLTVQGGFVKTTTVTDAAGASTTQTTFTLEHIQSVVRDPLHLQGLANSLKIAAGTTVLCLLIALPLAHLNTRYSYPGRAALTSLIMIPLILPPFVGAIGLRSLLGQYGAFNALLKAVGLLGAEHPGLDFLGGEVGGRLAGIVVAETLHLYPILYLNISAAMANLDPALDEAAVGLGASRWTRFRRITLPLITPGLFAGGTIVFIWSFTELGTPLMFNFYDVLPVQVFFGIVEIETNPRPYALVVVMLALTTVLYVASKWLVGGRSHAMQAKASVAGSLRPLAGVRGWMATLAFTSLVVVAALPHAGVVLVSLSQDGAWYRSVLPRVYTTANYTHALTHKLAMDSIRNSIIYAGGATVLCMVLGVAIAYLNVRVRARGAAVLDSLAMLPLAVPGLVMAFGIYAMTLRWPFPQLAAALDGAGMPALGSLLTLSKGSPNPLLILMLAYTVRRLPYVLRAASAGLEQTSGQLEEAALNLGASRATTLRRIVLPLIAANLIAGGILAFSFSMLEVSDSMLLAQKETHYPITRAIYELFSKLGDGPYIASAMGVWAMALLTVALVGASVLMGRKMGAIFRA